MATPARKKSEGKKGWGTEGTQQGLWIREGFLLKGQSKQEPGRQTEGKVEGQQGAG